MAFTGPCKGCGVLYGEGEHAEGCPVIASLTATPREAVGIWMDACAELRAQLAARDAALAEARGLIVDRIFCFAEGVAIPDAEDVQCDCGNCEPVRAWLAAHPHKGDPD